MLLKKVPDNINTPNVWDNPRIDFFVKQGQRDMYAQCLKIISDNHTTYYYRKIGDNLEHLGNFTHLTIPANQFGYRDPTYIPSFMEYMIFFNNYYSNYFPRGTPQEVIDGAFCNGTYTPLKYLPGFPSFMNDELYYTDEPYVAGVALILPPPPGVGMVGGKKTKKYRKKKINKKQRLNTRVNNYRDL